MKRRAAALGALLAGLAPAAGCGAGDDRDPPPRTPAQATATATATPEPAPPPPPAPDTAVVRFRAPDGERVRAQYAAAGPNAPAVVLLHEIRGGPDQWDDLVARLHAAGFATLAYESRNSALERERARDVAGALRWLRARRDVDPRRLALVGASIGASTAAYVMATRPGRDVDAAVALSPPESADIWALQDSDRYRPRDLLLIADEREAGAAEEMLDGATGSRFLRAGRNGHGVALLADAAVLDALLDWLARRVRG